jgi:RNA polymerase sigma-70 factor (ECF subfamily)
METGVSVDMEQRLAELMRAALGGAEAEYALFLRETTSLLRAFVRRKVATGGPVEGEDVLQEILLALHLKRHTWRADQPILPWIYAIARYKIVDAYRQRGRRTEIDIDDVADRLAAPSDETTSQRDIERALSVLPAGQQAVVTAISVDGRSIRETAERLDMKETAVRVALHRGLAAIAAKFGRT